MRKLGILLIVAVALFAQLPPDNYWFEYTGTGALTIQQPATNARQVIFPVGPPNAWFYCAAAQTVTLSWNGTAASTTKETPVKLPPTVYAAIANVYQASNVGAGTTGPVYNVPAGVTYPISLAWFRLGTTGNTTNLTFTPSGSCTMDLTWQEF